MKKIAVYGSLRQNRYNHGRLSGAKLLGVDTLYGFNMYSLNHGDYPTVVKGEDKIIVEVYEVEDDVAEGIKRMELDADYEEIEQETDYGLALMYVFSSERLAYYERRNRAHRMNGVGDWSAHVDGLPNSAETLAIQKRKKERDEARELLG